MKIHFTWIWYILSYNVFIWLRPWFLNTPWTNLPHPRLHLSVLKPDISVFTASNNPHSSHSLVPWDSSHKTGDFVLLVTLLLKSSSLTQRFGQGHISPRGFFAPSAEPGWGISLGWQQNIPGLWSGEQERACRDGLSGMVLKEELQVGKERAAGSGSEQARDVQYSCSWEVLFAHLSR